MSDGRGPHGDDGGRTGIVARLFRQSAAYSLASIAGPVVGLLVLPVYARFLSPADFGLLALIDVIAVALATIYSLGMTAAVPFYYVDHSAGEDRRRRLGALVTGMTLLNVGLTAVLWLTAPLLLPVLFPSVEFWPLMPIILLTALLDPYWTVAGSVLQIQERASAYGVLATGRLLLATALRLALVVTLGQGVVGFVIATLATAVVAGIAVAPLLAREIVLNVSVAELRRALALGGPTVPNNLFTYGFRAIDRIVMERLVAREQIGLYFLALRVADVLRLASEVIVSAWRPIFFKQADEPRFAATVVPEVVRLGAFGLLSAFVTISLFAPEAVALLLPPAFTGVDAFVPLLLAAMVVKGLYAFPYLVIWHRRKTAWLPGLTLIALLVSVGTNVVLGRRLGATGVAVALVLSHAVMFVVVLAAARRLYPFVFPAQPIAVAAAIAATVVLLATRLEPGLAAIAVKLVLLGGFLVGARVAGCIGAGELRALVQPGLAWRRLPAVRVP